MFGDMPAACSARTIGAAGSARRWAKSPAEFVREQSEGKLDFAWPAQVNRLLVDGGFDLILSMGQVVPHEVIGMANYNKNILVGVGGAAGIGRSHYLGAVYGMERIMGRADTPVRRVLNYAMDRFARSLPVVYALTVRGKDDDGTPGDARVVYRRRRRMFPARRRAQPEGQLHDARSPIRKAVVFLDPAEFKSTWIGNKAIYRTRMALADGAELVVLAPGVREFGEDGEIDSLDPKVRLPGNAGGAGSRAGQRGPGRKSRRRGAPDPRLLRGPLQHHLLPRRSDPPGDRRSRISATASSRR